jgi:two-component system copper resistance phosphate regulon response regulator CusR
MRILLVEDDAVSAARIKVVLEKAHFRIEVARDGETGLRMASRSAYALLILAALLPRRDGWSVCESLRRRRNTVPILMLTPRDSVDDRVRGLEGGADDCLPKPFDFRELQARVRALLRRNSVHKAAVLKVADLEIDTTARQVRRGGREIPLTPHEFTLLTALARHEGRALSRELILERVWGDEARIPNTVNFHVASLRRKVDAGHPIKLIQTVYGVGYVLRDPGG